MPKDDPVTAAGRPAGRWTRIALVLSLAVNLLVAGMAAGVVLRGGPPDAAVRDLGFGPFAAALSPADRAALRAAFAARARADGAGLGDGRRHLRADMRATLDALRADPFDESALRASLDGLSGRMSDRINLGMTLILDRVVALSTADRLAFADRLDEGMRRGPRRQRDRPSSP